MHEVAVVILNYNGAGILKTYLPSVIAHSGSTRIIIADNASTDKSLQLIRDKFPSLEIIENSTNGGYTKGYNDALQRIDAKFYVLLNSDVEVTANWLEPLVSLMEDESIAACQPKILSYRERDSFEHAGACGGYLDRYYFPFCRGRIFGTLEKDAGQYDFTTEIFWASGAALFIRSDVFHRLGGFDEDFFAHMEEIDLCWRIKRLSYKIMVEPKSVVYHLGGATLPYDSPQKVYLNFRNNLLMIVKNHPGLLFFKLLGRMCMDGIAAMRFLMVGEFRQFSAVFKAHMYLYGHFGKTMKKRTLSRKHTGEFNPAGIFGGLITWQYYVKKLRKFSELNQRLFK